MKTFRDLCDAFDSMPGEAFLTACVLLLVVVLVGDRVFHHRISKN